MGKEKKISGAEECAQGRREGRGTLRGLSLRGSAGIFPRLLS